MEPDLVDLVQVELVVARVDLDDHPEHLARAWCFAIALLVDRAEHAVAGVGEQVGRDAAPRLAEVPARLAQWSRYIATLQNG